MRGGCSATIVASSSLRRTRSTTVSPSWKRRGNPSRRLTLSSALPVGQRLRAHRRRQSSAEESGSGASRACRDRRLMDWPSRDCRGAVERRSARACRAARHSESHHSRSPAPRTSCSKRFTTARSRCCSPRVSRDSAGRIIEAQACGCPVICSTSEPLPEVAGAGAILCDPGDHAAFGRAILELARDAGRRDGAHRTPGFAQRAEL